MILHRQSQWRIIIFEILCLMVVLLWPSDYFKLGVFVDKLVEHDPLGQGVSEGLLKAVDLGTIFVYAGQEVVIVPVIAAGDQLGVLLVLRSYVGDSALLPKLGVDIEGLALEAEAVPAADQAEHVALALLRHLPVPDAHLFIDLRQAVRAVPSQLKVDGQIVLKQVVVVVHGPGKPDDDIVVQPEDLSEIMQYSAAVQLQLLLAGDKDKLVTDHCLH